MTGRASVVRVRSVPGRSDARQGFTLLEALVATTILAVGLAAVVSVFASSLKARSLAKGYEEARLEAESVMARILESEPQHPFTRSGDCRAPEGAKWEARAEVDAFASQALRIEVTVRFPAVGGWRTLTLATAQVDRRAPRVEQKKGA